MSLPSDAVVMCLGVRPVDQLKEELKELDNVYMLGDALKAGRRVPQAIHEAFEAAYNMK